MADQDDLLAEVVRLLIANPPEGKVYEAYDTPESTPWGAAQWIKITEAEGQVKYLRVHVDTP